MNELILEKKIESRIFLIRERKVMIDRDLAELYGVATKALNLAVRRNLRRFPSDFMFKLTLEEIGILRFQNETSSWGGRRYLPYAFTEQGVSMLSSVLTSDKAIDVNIAIMRAFVKIRDLLATHKDLARMLQELERKYDGQFRIVFNAIRQLLKKTKPSVHPPLPVVKGFAKL